MDYFIYHLKNGELTGGGPRSRTRMAVFIAFSFSLQFSSNFRINLEQRIHQTPLLYGVDVFDGKVAVGKHWPSEIRERLGKSRVVIADLTTMSPEVLFECGFGWGLGKPILPVTSNNTEYQTMPRWLTEWQVGHFSSDEGMCELLNSLGQHIADLSRGRRNAVRTRSAGADPRSVVLLKGQFDSAEIEGQVRQIAARNGMIVYEGDTLVSSLESTKSELAQQIAGCSLLVAPLTNQPSDSFMHFASGVVTSVPTAGASKCKLARRVLLVVNGETEFEKLPSDSGRRASDTVKVVTMHRLTHELMQYGEQFKQWLRKQETSNV